MKLKEGEYYYAPHRSRWGVWKVGKIATNGAHMDDFVIDCATKKEAAEMVSRLNGWFGK